MANYNDMSVGAAYVALPADADDTIIYCDDGEIRFTAHSNPTGNTAGIPLKRGQAHLVKAGTVLHVRSGVAVNSRLVRTVA